MADDDLMRKDGEAFAVAALVEAPASSSSSRCANEYQTLHLWLVFEWSGGRFVLMCKLSARKQRKHSLPISAILPTSRRQYSSNAGWVAAVLTRCAVKDSSSPNLNRQAGGYVHPSPSTQFPRRRIMAHLEQVLDFGRSVSGGAASLRTQDLSAAESNAPDRKGTKLF
jgi:hypothetical protein